MYKYSEAVARLGIRERGIEETRRSEDQEVKHTHKETVKWYYIILYL